MTRAAKHISSSRVAFRRSPRLKEAYRAGKTSRPLKTSETTLYIARTGSGIYKIGCTDNLKQRMRMAKTWCEEVRLIATREVPVSSSGKWREYERKLHSRFEASRCARPNGGKEVFRFSAQEKDRAVSYIRRMHFN